MNRLFTVISTSLAAMPLIAAAQTSSAPGGQASTATSSETTATTATTAAPMPQTHVTRSKRRARSDASTTDRNTEPGVNTDTAVTKGANVANTGQTQPRGSKPDTPTKKAE